MQSIIAFGRNSSMDPRSLENLFRILPEVFVLKNRIEAVQMLSNIQLCKL